MGLLAPSLLLGLLAAAVPYLIHRFGRRPPRPHSFAAMQLLLAAERRVRARHKVRELLLLLLRTAVAAALPLVFARPFVERDSSAPAMALSPQSAVILLDDSASMQRKLGRKSPFERAREQALSISRQMPTGSALALVLASEGNAAPIAQLTLEKSRVADAIEQVSATAKAADFTGGLRRATTMLSNAIHKERRIYVLTDGQAAGWEQTPPTTSENGPEVAVFDVTKGKTAWTNHAVVDIEAAPTPEAGVNAVAISASLANWGSTPVTVTVSLKIDGIVVAKGAAELPANGQAKKRFVHMLEHDHAGLHEVQVAIDPDDFALDDQRFASLAMVQSLRVLFINGDPRTPRIEDEGFFVESALQSAESGISVTSLTPDDAAQTDLASYGVIFVANVSEPSLALTEALTKFVSSGGGVFFSTGQNVNPDAWNSRLGGLLPQPLGVVRTAATQGAPTGGELVDERPAEHLAPVDRHHPLLAHFPTGSDGLASARFYKYTLLEPIGDDERHGVVLRFESGAPALVERSFPAVGEKGRSGHTMLLATTIDREWTDLAIRPGFLPLLTEITRRLGGAPEGGRSAELLVGASRDLAFLGAEDTLEVLKPGGDTWTSRRRGQHDAQHVPFEDTQLPGVYHVKAGRASDAKRIEDPNRTFVVNLDPSESNPVSRPEDQSSQGVNGTVGQRPKHKVPLWHMFGVGLMLLLLAESIVSLRRRPPKVATLS
jgi:hypothetical protein